MLNALSSCTNALPMIIVLITFVTIILIQHNTAKTSKEMLNNLKQIYCFKCHNSSVISEVKLIIKRRKNKKDLVYTVCKKCGKKTRIKQSELHLFGLYLDKLGNIISIGTNTSNIQYIAYYKYEGKQTRFVFYEDDIIKFFNHYFANCLINGKNDLIPISKDTVSYHVILNNLQYEIPKENQGNIDYLISLNKQ